MNARTTPMRSRPLSFALVLAAACAACATPKAPGGATGTPAPTTSGSSAAFSLGRFPVAPADALPADTAAALQAILDHAATSLPGVAATVIVAGRGTWSGAAGLADAHQPVVVQSKFGIASITKTVIAAEIMDLAEQGRLQLTDQLSKHLPSDFAFDTNGATIGNLLSMESGFPDPALNDTDYAADPARNWSVREVLATVPASRRTPGVEFVYEDANYMLLGLVVEAVTGKSVADALRSGVLADPRFASLVYQPQERPSAPLALPHLAGKLRPDILQLGGGYLPSRAEASEGNGSGCMASDSGTLALWGYQLFGGAILSQASVAAMTDFRATDQGPYGMGVFDQTNLAKGFGVPTVGNGGWDDGGYSSMLSVIPSRGTAIAVLTNTAGDPRRLVMPIAQDLAAVVR